jgi:hypothetical protein
MRASAHGVGIGRWWDENDVAAVSRIFFCSGRYGEEEEEEQEDAGQTKSKGFHGVDLFFLEGETTQVADLIDLVIGPPALLKYSSIRNKSDLFPNLNIPIVNKIELLPNLNISIVNKIELLPNLKHLNPNSYRTWTSQS